MVLEFKHVHVRSFTEQQTILHNNETVENILRYCFVMQLHTDDNHSPKSNSPALRRTMLLTHAHIYTF